MPIEIPAKKFVRILLWTVLFLTLASLAGQFSKHYLGHDTLFGFVSQFYLDNENNIPTWYSTVTLLLCSVLLTVISSARKRQQQPYALHWRALAIIFLLLSIDEAASIHELVHDRLQLAFRPSGLFYHAWVIPGIFFVLIVGFAYLDFLMNLPARFRWLFITSGLFYLTGALWLELFEGYYASHYGYKGMTYAMLAMLQELLEMLGIVLFLYALMSYISLYVGDIHVRFKNN